MCHTKILVKKKKKKLKKVMFEVCTWTNVWIFQTSLEKMFSNRESTDLAREYPMQSKSKLCMLQNFRTYPNSEVKSWKNFETENPKSIVEVHAINIILKLIYHKNFHLTINDLLQYPWNIYICNNKILFENQ